MRGKNLSNEISDGDTFYSKLQEKKAQKIRALKNTLSAKFTAKILNQFLEKTHQILKNHPENRKREKKGLLPANYILVRGASAFSKIPSFKKKYNLSACCIAGKTLYKGIGKILGMDLIKVKGANGLPSTNLKGKFLAAKKALRKLAPNQTSFGEGYDFVYLHIKAVDTFGEDGDWQGKKNFIEKIDKHLKILLDLKNVLIIITADHSTCCSLKRHCLELIPCLIYNEKIIPDNVKKFSEKECQKGKLGVFRQLDFMKKIFEV
jgi:2,3-bisphosphoglycerate-independent phosphoglycerate mutase